MATAGAMMPSNELTRIRAVYARRELSSHQRDRSNPGRQEMLRERDRALTHLLEQRLDLPLSECRVLDIGCGYGGVLGLLHKNGAIADNLFGIDLLPNRVQTARETYPDFTFLEGNAERLDFPDGSFDLVLLFTVFSSILDEVTARNMANEIVRVLKRTGAIGWYDIRYPNPWNSSVRAMTKSRIHRLFPDLDLRLQPLSLMPPLAHRLGRLTGRAYPTLSSIRLLRSHYLGLLRPRRTDSGRPSDVAKPNATEGSRHA
jgi:SAM-dependent methyltransferase